MTNRPRPGHPRTIGPQGRGGAGRVSRTRLGKTHGHREQFPIHRRAAGWYFLRLGGNVHGRGRSRSTASQIQAATAGAAQPGRAVPLAVDVSDEESVVALFQRVAEECGPCHLLVNCAGIGIGGPTTELSAETFSRVMAVNVLGPFLCAREAFKQMQKAEGGRIINVGSIAVDRPRPDAAPYTTSKHALQGLTRSLALDGRPHNIAVGIVHPGNVPSSLLPPEEIERRRAEEGFVSAEDVASCVVQMAVAVCP
ncbi:unnamed protein product [Prorocentrum cordatum]|uniref:SDR family oxidoreductase n=1 Tax=Prorocentrum cordatum TaxID=2364126 RepID=A0ABN9SWP5_9DINO|nr:unnamed protein product [Polarella glacialis]